MPVSVSRHASDFKIYLSFSIPTLEVCQTNGACGGRLFCQRVDCTVMFSARGLGGYVVSAWVGRLFWQPLLFVHVVIVGVCCIVGSATSEEFRLQSILKIHENVNVPLLLQKSLIQNGGIIWSTTHNDLSLYHIRKLSDQRPQRSCTHKVKRHWRTN